jgi:hypothetical protein
VHERLAPAIERWKAWFGRRDHVARRVLPEVVKWEWSTGSRHSLLPLHFERYRGRGRLLKQAPSPKAQHTETGLGSDGRLLVERVYDYRDNAHESFVVHGDQVTEVVEFAPRPHIPLDSAQIVAEDGRVVRYESFRLNGYSPKYAAIGRSPDRLVQWLGPNGRFLLVEEYRYDGPLLREIVVYAETPGIGPHRFVDRVSYDSSGALAGIDRTWLDGTVQTVFRPRRPGQTIAALRQAAVAELVEALPRIIGAAGFGERVYCIELSYRDVERYFPPLITLGFERDRGRARDPSLVFRPLLTGGRVIELPDPDALASCRQFDQEVLTSQRWQLGGRMLREAAAALTRRDWTGVLDVTDDFVVFALDPEATELEDALAASVPRERITEWKARGWL